MYKPLVLALASMALAQQFQVDAQPFLGSNPPGSSSTFQFTLSGGATNMSLAVANSGTAFSYLYLKNGGTASPANYDFVSRLDRTNNAINLEPPELAAPATYSLCVYTPINSTAQSFSVSLTTNRADARLASMPILKPLAFSAPGTLSPGGAQYFQFDVPTNLPGWRLVLTSSGTADADLYIQRGALPSTTSYLKRSTDRVIDTLFLDSPEATNGTYFVAVMVPATDVGSAAYTLSAEVAPVVALAWEPGTTSAAITAYTNQSTLGGDYFFKITTLNADSGAWRTRLDVQSSEADLYLRQGSLPTPTLFSYSSTRVGSDGLVLLQNGPNSQYQTNQVWYAMVTAAPGAQWSIYSGNLFIAPLPTPAQDSSGGTNVVLAPEGMNFFRTTINSNTIAWRLGLGGLTNSIYVHQGSPAFTNSASYYDWKQASQLLLVPPYLKSGTEYFVTIIGTNAQPFALDSRQQAVFELPFNSGTNVVAADYGYVTFHVQVPPQQIGWQLDLLASSGDPAIAVRYSAVPNEYVNTAYSATSNAAFETLTLVTPTLTDGSYYLTVFGTPPFAATLTNSRPVVTDVHYLFSVTNDIPTRQGWRYYSVTNIPEQLNSLGWELLLANSIPGTEIAIRQNAVPGRWAYRTNYTQGSSSGLTTWIDASSATGFLQQPRHPADIWYIGINNTNQALGPFWLTGREIQRIDLPLGPSFSVNQVSDQPAGRFQYFHIDVPTNALGIELQLANITSGDPRLVVCRGLLPINLNTWLINSNAWTPNTSTNWPVGAQAAYTTDWTGFTTDATGASEQGHFFFASQGNPLEPGAYYVGVANGTLSTNEMNYDLLVRGIFPDTSITDVPFIGSSSGNNQGPHQVLWQRVVVPTNSPSWNLQLGLGAGDSFFVFRKDGLPNYGATAGSSGSPTNLVGCLVRKTGDEHFLLLPNPPDTNVLAGTYYFGVVAEGQGPSGTRAGSNVCSFTFASEGLLTPANLGTVDPLGYTALVTQATQGGGEILGYQFTVLSNTPVIEVRLTNRVANPWMSLRADAQYGKPFDTAYGNLGGWTATWSDGQVIRVPWVAAGTYTLLVQAASGSGIYSNASYTLQVAAGSLVPVAFDGGMIATNQSANAWRYFGVTVPPDALGWDLRLTNITSGDPRLVVCRTKFPFDLTIRTDTGGSWTPYTATNWPDGWQVAPDADWTGYRQSAGGSNAVGTVFMAAMGNPLEPGNYVVGVASGTTGSAANPMSYTLVSRGIGSSYSIPITSLPFMAGQAAATSAPPREAAYYRVDVPSNSPSWQLHLGLPRGDGLLLVRKDGLPNFGASVTTSATNLAGCKLQKLGDEHFVLLPNPPTNMIPVGSYYLGVVSEGLSPTTLPSTARIGSNSCDYVLQSIGTLPVTDLGTIDNSSYVEQPIVQPGGSTLAFQFNVAPNTLAVVARLDYRTNNPAMTMRAGTVLPTTLENYGRQGGWSADYSSPNYIRLDTSAAGGPYTLMVQAEAVGSLYPDANYVLRLYPLFHYTIPLAFDGGQASFSGHLAGEWLFFSVNVPTNAMGWDLRLTNILSGSPRLVVCRSTWPYDLTSRLTNGTPWNWGSATNWLAGAQAAPTNDWTGYRFDTNYWFSGTGTNLIDTTGTIFAAGMGDPLEPGQYIVGVSSAPGTTAPMSYTITSRGIGTNFLIGVSPINAGTSLVNLTGLSPREAAYYSINVPTNTPLWKLGLAPSGGDALLVVRKDALPTVATATNVLASALGGGHKFQKGGGENALFGQPSGLASVPPGTYYLAVVGEGVSAQLTNSLIGKGTTDFSLTSTLPSTTVDLGLAGLGDLLITNSLQGGETAAYRFTVPTNVVSLGVSLENVTGAPLLRLRSDLNVPVDISAYGQDGGYRGNWEGVANTVPSPTAGPYTLTVLANTSGTTWPPLQYTLRIHIALLNGALAFDGGTARVNGQANSWNVFTVNVPTNALGWDLRLLNVSNGSPRLVIRRDLAPTNYLSSGVSFSSTTWPTGTQLAPTNDWTLLNEADGTSSTGRVFQVGMGNPLQAGLYYVGITNLDGVNPASYTVYSRGIGSGFIVGVQDLPFVGGSDSEVLPAREAAWYRLVIPNNAPSWKVALNFDAGDGLLMVQRGALPNPGALSANILANVTGGKKMQKLGDEHLLSWAGSAGGTLTPGTYYLGVVSEGLNPSNALSRIGSGSSSFTLYSDGSLPPLDMGWVGVHDLAGQAWLEGGECETWSFTVPPGIPALRVSVDTAQTTGNPMLTMTMGTYAPAAAAYPSASPNRYGTEGGVTALPQWGASLTNAITIPNPAAGDYTITVQAAGSGISFPDSDLLFWVRSLPIPEVNFDAALITNGLSNVAGAVLQDGFKDYYRVQVPYTVNGTPVIGWKLSLSAQYGTPRMRVRRGALPDDTGTGTSTNFLRQAVFVSDYLSPGTWYVEVSATGLTDYTLTSESLTLILPAWPMPPPGVPFGDTGARDLEQDSSHYYAVTVPPGNGGLLRTELDAISGNPTLYLRYQNPPTLSHNALGASGSIYDRVLTNTGTEYGNWVALDGKSEVSLPPGQWYLAVHATGGGSVRYRLQVSTGAITDVAFAGGSLAGQALAAGDWRYYRIQLPVTTPDSWALSVSAASGSVAVYLRDTIPPGQGTNATDFVEWSRDEKNQGPYPWFTNAGTYTLTVPAVRPGNTYFVGVRAVSDASFSISSSPGPHLIVLDGIIPFLGGSVTNQLPPGGILRYRIDVPAEAVTWSHSAIHASSVRLYLEQGTLPTLTLADHWYSSGANSVLDVNLASSSWPWLPGYSYYLTVTNLSTSTQPFSFHMNGTGSSTNTAPVVISSPAISADGSNFVFTVSGSPGLTYRVLVSSNPAAGTWLEYAHYVQSTPVQTIILPIDKQYPVRFYRISFP